MRRYVLIAAVILFAGGLIWSIRVLPESVELSSAWPLVKIALLGVFARQAVSILELKASAPLAGAKMSWSDSAQVSIVSSAAKMLPLPGGPMVRIAALKLAGGTVVKSSTITLSLGLAWLGLAVAYAGIWLLSEQLEIAAAFLVVALTSLAIAVSFMLTAGGSWRVIIALLLIKAFAIAVGLQRLFWAFAALGEDLELGQLAVFAVSGVAGSIFAIVPAGIGVNETAAAILAPLVGVDSATAFLAASLNRLVGLPVLLLVALFVAMSLRKRNRDLDEH